MWIPAKQKWLEFEVKDPLQNIKMTAEVKIESELLCCSGQVVKNLINKNAKSYLKIPKA